ncbi:hypothetical protein Rhopal_002451-T1 [Rhodotorula paludigena]|uniref:Uncharacterized protein n=1 Tax=Rhodotorula paludigena TaxID=86838 RepID=A0AAV5GA96_9BASI|nr:hypothetical protein Rhopal_002451-T1 [Rhodotorula paludigena]
MLSLLSSALLPLPFSILLLSLLSAPSPVSAQTITSPASVVQCLPVALTLEGGSAPYTVSVLPGGQVSAAPLETLPEVTAPGTVTWLVDLEAGQDITFSVRDATGALGYSAPIPILSGTSSECLGTNAGMTVSSLVPTTTIASSVTTSTVSVPSSTSTTSGADDDETSTTSTPSSTSAESETSTSTLPTTSTTSARSTSSSRTPSSTNPVVPTVSSAAEAATDNGSGASEQASGGVGWKSLALALSLAIALVPLA